MDTQQDSVEDNGESEEIEIRIVNSLFTLIFLTLLLFLILGIYDHSIIPIPTR